MAQQVETNETYINELHQLFHSDSKQQGLDPLEYARKSFVSTLNERKGFGYWHVRRY